MTDYNAMMVRHAEEERKRLACPICGLLPGPAAPFATLRETCAHTARQKKAARNV